MTWGVCFTMRLALPGSQKVTVNRLGTYSMTMTKSTFGRSQFTTQFTTSVGDRYVYFVNITRSFKDTPNRSASMLARIEYKFVRMRKANTIRHYQSTLTQIQSYKSIGDVGGTWMRLLSKYSPCTQEEWMMEG